MASSLKWYASNVKATFERPIQDGSTRVAMRVRRQARRNVTENGQIDTKHMWNSIGVATPDKITPIPPDGEYRSTKTGKMVYRESGPVPQPQEGATVFAAATHSIYLEVENSFLWRAIEQVQGKEAEEAFAGVGVGLFAPDVFEDDDE